MDSAEALEIVGDLASQQWGLVTSAQAKDQGVDVPTLSRLTRSGVLERVRHGVYVTPGATQSAELELKAQWLALKPDLMAADRLTDPQHAGEAVVSHTTAAELWGIGDLWSDGIHFTTKTRRRSRQAEVTFHTADFAEEDWVIHPRARLPVTTVGRTIADLARDGHEADHLLNLVADAAANELIDQETLLEAVTGLEVEFGLKAKDVRGLKLLVSSRFPVDETEHKLSSMIEDAIGPIQKRMEDFLKQQQIAQKWMEQIGAATYSNVAMFSSMQRLLGPKFDIEYLRTPVREMQNITPPLPDLAKRFRELKIPTPNPAIFEPFVQGLQEQMVPNYDEDRERDGDGTKAKG